ncbi:MAG: hypothetical protein SFU86_05895 [Pirellulaceae bacterium]|nr:hypothetical protein [Pirellulaceae bacterium]
MARSLGALALVLFALTAAHGADPPLSPQAGVLVLRNGEVLAGEITRAGDYYVVTLGATGEVRLPAVDVEMQAASLNEAYDRKREAIFPRGIAGHLELAEWCLRQRLPGKCAEQIVAAMRLDPQDPRVAQLERRLALASQAPSEGQGKSALGKGTISAEELEKAVRDLPAGSIERFSLVVQPILLNRCGANQCHGPNAKSEFRLLKSPVGLAANQRFTQRNLYAVMQQIDRSQPEASPLITLPQRRHGSALAAVFDKQSQKQLDELTQWVKLTTAAATPPQPATIPADPKGTLSQPAPTAPAAEQSAIETSPSAAGSAPAVRVMRPPLAGLPAKAAAPANFLPRDEFDPEIFNRRFTRGEK